MLRVDGMDLLAACRSGETGVVQTLLDRGAEVDMQDADGSSPLMVACYHGHAETAKVLLDGVVEVGFQRTDDGCSALMLACENGHVEVARLLLAYSPEVDLQETDGWTALMSASSKGSTDVAKLLLDRGAKVNLQACDGSTALMLACRNGQTETAELLLDRGATLDSQGTNGSTALMLACHHGRAETARLLLDRGAEVDLEETNGQTALMSACKRGHTEAAGLLLDRGAKVDLRKTDGATVLMLASEKGHAAATKLLLDRGAKVDLQMPNGATALMLASDKGHAEVARLLLDRGAGPNMQKTDGRTALMAACLGGHPKAAKLLLDRGAKVEMQDAKGNTALAWATQGDFINRGRAEMDRLAVSIIKLLCTRSNRHNFADLGGPVALATARKNRLDATAELLEFVSASSPLARYDLPLKTLACFYAENVRTPKAAAGLSGPELYFMGLKDSNQRHEAMLRFRAAARDEQSDDDTLDAHRLRLKHARDAHRRGQDAIDCNMRDLCDLLSLRFCKPAASHDFNAASNTIREAKRRLKALQTRAAADGSLIAERDEVRDKLMATISGSFRYLLEQLENNNDPAAPENMCSRVWARLSDEALAGQGGLVPSDEEIERACRAAEAVIAAWKQRKEVISARRETDKLVAAMQPQSFAQTCSPQLGHSPRREQMSRAATDAITKELGALLNDDPMDEVPLAEIRCALELIIRRHAEARGVELVRWRAAAHDMQIDIVEGLIDRIYEVRSRREELEMKLRHARGKRPRAGACVNAEKLAKLEDERRSLPCVHALDRKLRQERARAIRHAERYDPKLLQDSAWRERIGLSGEVLLDVGKLDLWLAAVTRADFAQVKALATRPGKDVFKVRDPNGRVMVLKSFHLSNAAWHGRFCSEVRALAELKSRFLVHIEALFVDASFGCILVPYYEGGDLAAWIRGNPHATDETRKRIAMGVLSGVHDLHQRKLVHCNIKPENIFLTQALTPVLGDFTGVQMSNMAMTQPLQTTARYGAPELRAGGTRKATPAVDMFSVGVLLGEIFPTPSAALQDLIDKLQADDPTQRPSALKALGHEAFHTRPMRSRNCIICFESKPESEGLCCESKHFMCKSCLGTGVRAASQPGTSVQVRRDCSMPCVVPRCRRQLLGSDLAAAIPDEFQTLLQIVRGHYERETAATTETEIQRRLNEARQENPADRSLREHVVHIQNRILTLSCPRCETAFADFDGCSALKCSNPRCACYFCAWCLQSSEGSRACHAHVARCSENSAAGGADVLFVSDRRVLERAWCRLRAARLRAYARDHMRDRALRTSVREMIQPLLTADVVGPDFRF